MNYKNFKFFLKIIFMLVLFYNDFYILLLNDNENIKQPNIVDNNNNIPNIVNDVNSNINISSKGYINLIINILVLFCSYLLGYVFADTYKMLCELYADRIGEKQFLEIAKQVLNEDEYKKLYENIQNKKNNK
jgi:hypothetical protein